MSSIRPSECNLKDQGYLIRSSSIAVECKEELRRTLFTAGQAGTRCLLDVPVVQEVALTLKQELQGVLPETAVAIQAIAFDKTPDANWKVTWHQDLMFPFAHHISADGYTLPSVKDGIDYARPPLPVLEEMLAVRLHLDDCDDTNGPLRVCPGTHRLGFIPSAEIPARIADTQEVRCLAAEGEALLMRPLLLHASSKALEPKHRRVLHIVFHSGCQIAEQWHRAIG